MKLLLTIPLLGAAALLTGCAVDPGYVGGPARVYGPQPAYYGGGGYYAGGPGYYDGGPNIVVRTDERDRYVTNNYHGNGDHYRDSRHPGPVRRPILRQSAPPSHGGRGGQTHQGKGAPAPKKHGDKKHDDQH